MLFPVLQTFKPHDKPRLTFIQAGKGDDALKLLVYLPSHLFKLFVRGHSNPGSEQLQISGNNFMQRSKAGQIKLITR
jgi:hypothetical protein